LNYFLRVVPFFCSEEVKPVVELTTAEKKRAKLNSLVNSLAKRSDTISFIRPPSPQGIKEDRAKKAANVETLNLDDDDDDEPLAMPSTSRSLSTVSAKKSKEVDYVTLDSDDEEIIVPPSGKRRRIEDDSDSASVSALTPLSVTPPPPGYSAPPADDDIICLSD